MFIFCGHGLGNFEHTCALVEVLNRTQRNSTVLTEASARDDVEWDDWIGASPLAWNRHAPYSVKRSR